MAPPPPPPLYPDGTPGDPEAPRGMDAVTLTVWGIALLLLSVALALTIL